MCRCGAAAVWVVQPARAVRGGHGAGHRLRRHRQQGRSRPHRTHEEWSRQLCPTGEGETT